MSLNNFDFTNVTGYSHYIVFKGYKSFFVLANGVKVHKLLDSDIFYYDKKYKMFYNEKCKIFPFDGNLQHLLNTLPYSFKGAF